SSPGGAGVFSASGAAASLFLDRAFELGSELRDPGGQRLVFSADEVRPSLRLRAGDREDVRSHPILAMRREEAADLQQRLHDGWLNFNEGAPAVAESRFREILGLPASEALEHDEDEHPLVLEAVWIPARTASGSEPITAHPVAEAAAFHGATGWVFLPRVG